MKACSTTPEGAVFKSCDFKGTPSGPMCDLDDPAGKFRSNPCFSNARSGTTLEDAPEVEWLAMASKNTRITHTKIAGSFGLDR